ncbi:MAG TPA: hypothetical protein VGC42_21650 [Kofleriaceae bacterium]
MVLAVWLAGTAACKSGNEPDAAASKAQEDLVRRRDTLLAQRAQLEEDRQKVLDKIKATEASGGDTKDLAKQRDDLTAQIDGQSVELGTMSNKLSSLSTKLDSAADIASREDRLAQREGKVAGREATIGERERTLAAREAQLAQREKDTCGTAAPVVIQAPAPASGKYSKAEVQPLLSRARATMQRKGLLSADLGPSQALETESTRAMAEGDWGRAVLAATQLVQNVDAIKVDRAFIQAKTARLSNQLKATKVDDATNQQLAGVLADVMQKYADGKFEAANVRLNQLAAQLK